MERDETNIAWDAIVNTLGTWRKGLGDPSVTTIAEKYSHDPWAVLSSTILSLRTKDEVTLRASAVLLKKAPTPAALLKLDTKMIQDIIFPVGFYRTKALNLQRIAKIIIEKYKGLVPDDFEALLELPGVGRKTANLVFIEAFGKEGICVDTHVHRICNRTGWIETKTPEHTEMRLRAILPRRHWKGLNALLVLYGQQVCRPINPFCSVCPIKAHCNRNNVIKSH
ncbi:MAG: endonuclease III [Spirochaetaceae bacterium]|jgi:endonuclease-3|nr:endonuclease III [Spirochaetaceae bacterium]